MIKGKIFLLLFSMLISASCVSLAEATKLVTYPAPISEKAQTSWAVTVDGKKLDIYKALSPKFEGGEYYFTYFDFEGAVDVKVSSRNLKNAEVYPATFDVEKSATSLKFTADKPFKTIVLRNERAMPLIIFGNPIEKDIPNKEDKNVIFFEAGTHYLPNLELKSNQTLYIAGGAVLKTSLKAVGENITVRGRGILSFDNRERFYSGATNFSKCENLIVKDIILKDAMTWTLVFRDCNNVTVDNIKICCSRMINDDAIDICNTSNITIKNIFARAQDDIIAIKGIYGSALPCENMTVEDSILWTDSANTFRIGYECHTPKMSNLRCKNLYIPFYAPYRSPDDYWSHAIIWFQPTHDMPMTNMYFDGIDIRSNGEDMPVVIANPRIVDYKDTKTAGNIADCLVKNVTVHGKKGDFKGLIYVLGKDSTHNVKNLTIENFTYFGEKIKQDCKSVFIGDFSENIVVK